MSQTNRLHRPAGFTLVEMMIIVALLGLLVSLMTPGFMRSRKQSQGKRIMNDVRVIDSAIDAWALEAGKSDGAAIDLTQVATYSKSGSIPTADALGNTWVIGTVGADQIKISPTTKAALAGVGLDWGAY